jgi:hypothetical protein
MPSRVARAIKALLGPRLPLPVGAHVCIVCRRDCVNPVAWDEVGEDRWRVAMRCGACGHEHERELSQTDAGHLLNALERGYGAIEAAATRLHQELMTEWVETFAAALHRDLIDAGDFRTAYSVKPRSNVS